ncbi:MAG: secondary thiamine-phosphate synthase enzyme YjbQ [Hyphomonadaceae bacterium]|nr:secondary thiamine-phosphate synthase enzyme YjbQ [Hyphomonadaceae bacterium]
MQSAFSISPRAPGLYEFTDEVRAFVRKSGATSGLLTLFVQHTSCSIVIQENADPDVRRDLGEFFRRLAPHADQPSMGWIRHRTEGADDMPAHIKAAVLPTSLSIPIVEGKLALGTWQGVYLFEHRDEPQTRRVVAHISS